jgi:hypothetical protein
MRESLREVVFSSIQNGCNSSSVDQKSAIHCTVARAIWPQKTAAHWAAAAGVQERMAKYWLAGTHRVSDGGKLAIIRLLDD